VTFAFFLFPAHLAYEDMKPQLDMKPYNSYSSQSQQQYNQQQQQQQLLMADQHSSAASSPHSMGSSSLSPSATLHPNQHQPHPHQQQQQQQQQQQLCSGLDMSPSSNY